MGYVIRGRTNHKSAYPDSPLLPLALSLSTHVQSSRAFFYGWSFKCQFETHELILRISST